MRVFSKVTLLAGSFLVLMACASPPPFTGITSVQVRHIGSHGLKDKVFTERQTKDLIDCLYTTKLLASEEETERDLLKTTYLIQISDSLANRSFELYTRQNLKGNKGNYYLNTCLYNIIETSK